MTCSNQMHLSPEEGERIHEALFSQLSAIREAISTTVRDTDNASLVGDSPYDLSKRLHDLALSYADTLSALRKVEAAFDLSGTLPWGEPITLDHDPEVTRPAVRLEEEAVADDVPVTESKDEPTAAPFTYDLPLPRRSPYKPKR